MTETLWGVVVGGLIGAITALLTTWLTSRIESRKWTKEKKLEHLLTRKNDLKSALERAGSVVEANEEAVLAGNKLPPIKPSDLVILQSNSEEFNLLWADVINIAKESQDDWEPRYKTYGKWFDSIRKDITEIDVEIEKLLKAN